MFDGLRVFAFLIHIPRSIAGRSLRAPSWRASEGIGSVVDASAKEVDALLNEQQLVAEQHKVTRKEITVIGIVLAGAFLAILNQTVLSPALPKLMDAFSISAGTAQWVTSIYMLVNGIMVPITGFLIDRFSTRKLFFVSLISFIVGTALCAGAQTFELLMVGRVLPGGRRGRAAAARGRGSPCSSSRPRSAARPWAWPAS